ncbi:DUF2306 domain-containing protein [Paenibacillus cymbidii]|uniref:DUF2306 domain-containing protein n=1 Tax=Paenibacillus cymbidii TaxID=1639034 RepID=UPI001F458626|nr:DUF2306 domain-containing protein [Paenibacillus cymbidii]
MSIVPGTAQYSVLVAHIAFAFVAMATGFLQFVDRLCVQRPAMHRMVGRVYVGAVFVSGLLAFLLIFYIADYGRALSFLVLALAWLWTCWKGYRAAVRGKYDEHRAWMIRSFGITLVAVSARLLVPVLLITYLALHGFSLPDGREGMVEQVLNVNVWAGIVVDVMIVEWVVLRKNK